MLQNSPSETFMRLLTTLFLNSSVSTVSVVSVLPMFYKFDFIEWNFSYSLWIQCISPKPKLTRNATHCNSRDDLPHFSFTSKIYDGAFIAKIVSHQVYSQKSSIVDACLGSKYALAFWRLLKRFISFKYFTV